MMSDRARDTKNLQMDASTRGAMRMARCRVKESIHGKMDRCIKENGWTI